MLHRHDRVGNSWCNRIAPSRWIEEGVRPRPRHGYPSGAEAARVLEYCVRRIAQLHSQGVSFHHVPSPWVQEREHAADRLLRGPANKMLLLVQAATIIRASGSNG